ncbi:hypothetical protein J7L67_01840 [bacterium]|nr:hypothetical protein [bacterium]
MKKFFLLIFFLALSTFFYGCSKKDNPDEQKEQSAGQDTRKQKMDLSLKKQKLNNDIYLSFPMIKNYLFSEADILSQEKSLNENKQSIHKITAVKCVFETSEPLESVHEHYKKIFPEDKFRINYKDNKIRAFFCSDFLINSVDGLSCMVTLKSTKPFLNFTDDVIDKQIEVIRGQITQYEKIKKILQNKLSRKIAVEKTYLALQDCLGRMKELKIQASALSNKSTLIELSLGYILPSQLRPQPADND